jgi:malate/lactate dehydrogenase
VSGVCPSVPVVVGWRGVARYLHPDLNAEETAQFRVAAEAVKTVKTVKTVIAVLE